ncbi:MAG: ABC transporter ATP-binding protein [Oceanospirillaceae bacterium]|nr:ABC transporter ATP-binding protein [Oceanospirillaceae bacterium]
MKSILKIDALVKSYDQQVNVLNNINLEMEPGGFLILVGPSGCGKSTLLNCIAGLETTTGGSIQIAERDVTNVESKDRDIAMVFQSYALYPTMTVKQNIAFGMKVRGVPKAEQETKIAEVSNLLQITALLDRKPGQLSGGQRQRVAIGRALVRQPSLYLFDEPLSNLDAKLRVEMRAELKALHDKTQSSFVYVTHDQVEAMTMGTKIAVLNGGSIQQFGSPAEIYHNPANVFVASFMGSPPMNIIPATVTAVSDSGVSVEYSDDQGKTHSISTQRYSADQLTIGQSVLLGIRPEHCHLEAGDSITTMTAAQVEVTGFDQYVKFKLEAGRSFTARFSDAQFMHSGDSISFGVKSSEVCFFNAETELAIAPLSR